MQVSVADQKAVAACGLEHKYLFSSDLEAPLYLLVHGRAGTFEVMWTFRRSLPQGVNILSPQAPLSDPLGGFSWWDIEARPGLDQLKRVPSDCLFPFLDNAQRLYNLKPRHIVALGFSQGAGLLSMALQLEPSKFKALCILAGFVIELPEIKEKLIGQSLPAVFMAHGSKDQAVPIERAYRGRDYLKSIGLSLEFVEDNVGHKVGSSGMRSLSSWLSHLS